MKKILLACTLFLLMTACQTEERIFLKYATRAGIEVAKDAGVFKARKFVIKKQFKGDTLFYYNGINQYFIQKTDSTIIVNFVPNVETIKDTIFYYIKNIKQSKQ